MDRGIQISIICPWCGIAREDMVHLFWDCYLADIVWLSLKEWLGINFNSLLAGEFCIDRIFSLNIMQGARSYWHIFAAAALWTIWKIRNVSVFQNKRLNNKEISRQLKFTAYSWARTLKGNFLNSHGLVNLWDVNPVACLRIHMVNRKDYFVNLMLSSHDFVGFTDGSLTLGPNDNLSAGIGGVLYNKKKR